MTARPRSTNGRWPRRSSATGEWLPHERATADANERHTPVREGFTFDEAALARWMRPM
jgi:hypothetical protein